MDREILFRFMQCETTPQEELAVLNWLDEDQANQHEMDRLDEIFNAMVLHAPAPAPRRRSVFTLRNVCRFAVSASAMIALIVGGGYWFSAWRIKDFSSRMLTICAPEGQRIHTVLQDGTQVWLNGNSKMEYPVAFSGQSRCVKITGEVMFDVAQCPGQPFIVHTYAGTVEVLGTKFDVLADEANDLFSTALLRGKVRITSEQNETVALIAGQYADLQNGHFVKQSIERPDDYLWPDGIIALNSSSFTHLAAKIERAYNVKMELQCKEVPVIKYRGKIRIVEGLEHALKILLAGTDRTFEIDYETNRVYIR